MIYVLGKSTPTWQNNSSDTTFIAAECQISGSVTINGNARIDGRIDGNVYVTGDLTVGPGAVLRAEIEAKTVVVAGEVHGDIKATETLELSQSARLFGDIYSKQLKIEQGARFVGSSKPLEDKAASANHAPAKPAQPEGNGKNIDKK